MNEATDICITCSGTGEGYWSGSVCGVCGGTGEMKEEDWDECDLDGQ